MIGTGDLPVRARLDGAIRVDWGTIVTVPSNVNSI